MIATMTERRHPLADLILAVKDSTGLGYRDLATRARNQGHKISTAQINNLALGHVSNIPDADMVRALAAALGLPYSEVLNAMLDEFLGYQPVEIGDEEGIRRHVALPPDATEDERQEAQLLIDAWLAARRQRNESR